MLCVPNNQEEALSGALKILVLGFPGGSVVKNPPANAGEAGPSVMDFRDPKLPANVSLKRNQD